MDEFGLIRRFFAAAACARLGGDVVTGIGDDCAILSVPAGEQLVVSTDTLVAGVHFPDPCDPFLLGQRALAVATSDLAAMGATPIGFTLALSLTAAEPSWLEAFARGLDVMAAACDMQLVGGDTTRGPLSLTLTVFGRVPVGQALLRSGACVGDLLCVGGTLGEAAGALPLVLGACNDQGPDAKTLLARYWSPQPQLALGQALRGRATAALDISDGLLADCGHIAAASSVGFDIEQARVPLAGALIRQAGKTRALDCALSGGDDYVLAFTLPPAALPDLQAEGWPAWVIGRVRAGQGVRLLGAGGAEMPVGHPGYNHFNV